jgi:S1-C subfamily serine protease
MYIKPFNSNTICVVIVLAILFSLVLCDPSESASPKQPSNNQLKSQILSTKTIAKNIRKALVVITTQGVNGEQMSLGSGFFIDENTIVTNLHIFKRAVKASVELNRFAAT